jgi:hypothetical protein
MGGILEKYCVKALTDVNCPLIQFQLWSFVTTVMNLQEFLGHLNNF